MRRVILLVFTAFILLWTVSCASWSRKQKGAAIGTGTGAVVGGIIGKQAGNTAIGAILGAVVGGAAGAYIGNYMDKQASEMSRDLEGAKIERVGEGIKITFDSGILFAVNKATLNQASRDNLRQLAGILNKYKDTNILVEGHTDNTGSEEYNMELSKLRAQSVANYLEANNVAPDRFTIMGYGETQPVATNATPQGRQLNRRVDIAVYANKKLKQVAEQKTSG